MTNCQQHDQHLDNTCSTFRLDATCNTTCHTVCEIGEGSNSEGKVEILSDGIIPSIGSKGKDLNSPIWLNEEFRKAGLRREGGVRNLLKDTK